MNDINFRLDALREVMRRERLSAFVFPSSDPHNGEYIPDHWAGRRWISGFTGSAGTAVVTLHSAALWTDSRYFIAAAEELKGTEYQLMKLKMPGTPSISEWIASELSHDEDDGRGHEVGVDGMVYSASAVEELIGELRANGGITVRTNLDPLQAIWTDRPAQPLSMVELQPLQYSGKTACEKLADIRKALRRQHADGMLVAALDDIAWTLNIRAQDVHCNPVALSYLLITTDNTTLFVNSAKITSDVRAALVAEGVSLCEYTEIKDALRRYPDYNILMDPDEINYTLYSIVRQSGSSSGRSAVQIVRAASPIPAMKAVKTTAEIQGFRNAMLRDGVALAKFTCWLKQGAKASAGKENIIIDGEIQTEMTVDRKLTALRTEQPLFRDISFDTIAGYAEHGAIVHYEATPDTDKPLAPRGFLLLDSGAQYQDGTTDITRTIPLGPLTDEERLVYTLVLKGHIDMELLKFPDGASGTQLDAIARKDLWKHGYNFLHGTGHGVGSYLNVHEGPHQIRMEYRPAPMRAGMTVTDEPGIYIEGCFGVRIENTLLVREYQPSKPAVLRDSYHPTPEARFLEFDALTICPIDKEPIIVEMLTAEERQWLNQYHQRVYDELSPYLTAEERQWLQKECDTI